MLLTDFDINYFAILYHSNNMFTVLTELRGYVGGAPPTVLIDEDLTRLPELLQELLNEPPS